MEEVEETENVWDPLDDLEEEDDLGI